MLPHGFSQVVLLCGDEIVDHAPNALRHGDCRGVKTRLRRDVKIADFETFAEVLAIMHPDQYLTATGVARLREIHAEQRAIRLANGGR